MTAVACEPNSDTTSLTHSHVKLRFANDPAPGPVREAERRTPTLPWSLGQRSDRNHGARPLSVWREWLSDSRAHASAWLRRIPGLAWFVEALLVGDAGSVGTIGRYLPGALGNAASGQVPQLAAGPAMLLLVLYAAAAATAGWLTLPAEMSRDPVGEGHSSLVRTPPSGD